MKKKQLVSAAAFALIAFTAVSCKDNSNNNDTYSTQEQTQNVSVMQVDDVLAQAGSLTGTQVFIEGICTHICQHGGGKIFLMGSDDTKTIRIEAGDQIGKFSADALNNIVQVKGRLVEERIDEAYLSQWEAKIRQEAAPEHGKDAAGCSSEQKAQGEAPVNSPQQRIDNFRKRIVERGRSEGKDYLSFYHIQADEYSIQ